jgi:dTDP-4-amino-4,6-dideoxygalactose transaminase
MTEWQGAILLVQLTRLPEQMATRARNARYLADQLSQVGGIQPLRIDPRVTSHAWHLFVLRYQADEFGGLHRDQFIELLGAEGIPCSPGYLPLSCSEAMIEGLSRMGASRPQPCPVAERACHEEAVWLTQNMLLGTTQDMDTIVEAIVKIKRWKG